MDTSINAANQVVSVAADIAFYADPKFFACLVRFVYCNQMDTSVNADNQVVSVGADTAVDAAHKLFVCVVRFESSWVQSTLQTGYDVYPLFFFQEEDGIRDVAVTGVQTCALPI